MVSGDSEILRSFIKDILSLPDQEIIDKWSGTPDLFKTVSSNPNIFPIFGIRYKLLASNEIRLDPPNSKQPIWVYIDNQMV